jgi:ribosomal protein L15
LPTKDRKVRKYRGSRTHGYGQIGQHRCRGGRGGTGKAGLDKHKWTYILSHNPDYWLKKGFVSARMWENWMIWLINWNQRKNWIKKTKRFFWTWKALGTTNF